MNTLSWQTYLPDFWLALAQTLYMVAIAGPCIIIVGLAVGTTLYLTAPHSLSPKPVFYYLLTTVVNMGRSIPFLILIVLLIPITRALVGTTLGPAAAIIPLVLGFSPFFSRLVEAALRELDQGRIDAARTMGVSKTQFVFRVLLPESFSGLLNAITIILVGTVEGTAVAGAVGAGGVGDFAIEFGYQRFYGELMFISVLAMVIIVQLIQLTGDVWIRARKHKR
ncbi:methionine ABC transporter permease [Pseudomonas typographi]|uniref:ABC transporter permease n=1 Tax=Pseudomonas typographi TaxID=2715964 RepID=A0ABR7YZS2_9PSED|nr:methionine ABC transporter permease [Pseudomonas typographi]MBD1550580.1 ABC transporter permease [Pseudomonas typographi]MBD1586835.1 ABC transporter permease [Pseudomonas typographi]MBD1598729.1 ABC transporter permease [Pseudomonas typographi]